jgi:hypothetical protein
LVTTDLESTAEDLVARYASRWGIEQAFADARHVIGVGQARNRLRRAVERAVPFGLTCLSLITVWYALHGHAPDDALIHRARARWYTTKTEPSYDDMVIKLRRVIIAARFRSPCPDRGCRITSEGPLKSWVGAGLCQVRMGGSGSVTRFASWCGASLSSSGPDHLSSASG